MIIGIDLGTSTSEAAYVDETGKVVVIPDSKGESVIPSVVHIKKNGGPVVGAEAREYLFTRPDCTFMEVKRKFGTGEKLVAHGKILAPEEIQACIIEYLVDCAEEYADIDVTGVVITVPAYFTDVQRKQTIRAGELAGVDVERVINEPTAAAMDYGLHNMNECEYMLVYDFGGGTLDVTVLELYEGVIDVKSSCGNNHLGGKDFDEVLMKHIAGGNYDSLMADPKAQMQLKQAATACKIALSNDMSAQVRLPLITEELSIDMTVTRAEFEGLIKPMVDSTWEQIETALHDAGLSPSDLQRVILVGGTTRVPFVRKFVEDKLGVAGARDSDFDFDPDLMVVRGAAIQAAIIGGVIEQQESVVLADVCPFTLGLKVVTKEGFIVDPLIRRNVTIPYEFSKVYTALTEYQSAVHIEIYQGESTNSYENTRIGEMDLDKLPQRRDELAKAEVTFSYDINGLLNVKARALGNDKTASIVIDINNNELPVQPPVKISDWTKSASASKYRPLLRKVQKELGEYAGTNVFIEDKLYYIYDLCDALKADIILGNEIGAKSKSNLIKAFLDEWEPPDMTDIDIDFDDD